jgi:hypothetical protein
MSKNKEDYEKRMALCNALAQAKQKAAEAEAAVKAAEAAYAAARDVAYEAERALYAHDLAVEQQSPIKAWEAAFMEKVIASSGLTVSTPWRGTPKPRDGYTIAHNLKRLGFVRIGEGSDFRGRPVTLTEAGIAKLKEYRAKARRGA